MVLGYIDLTYISPSIELSTFEGELADVVPVVHCQIGGCRIVGRLTVGESEVQLLPFPSCIHTPGCFIQSLTKPTKKCFKLKIK